MNILFIGAHPDDIEVGAGGTVARFVKEGENVSFLILTNGETAGNPLIRRQEAVEGAKILGVTDIIFSDIKDSDKHVRHDNKTISIIEEVIRKKNPDKIFVTTLKDAHQDHKNAALATISAARTVPNIFFYEVPSSFPDFRPHLYVDISETINQKIEALNAHRSQNKKRYMKIDLIIGITKQRAYQSKMAINNAEAFEIFRSFM